MRRSGFEFIPIMSHALHKGDRGQSDSRVQTSHKILMVCIVYLSDTNDLECIFYCLLIK